MIIQNAKVFNSKGFFEKRELTIKDDSGSVLDARGALIFPGLVDIHLHGAVGCDFSDANESSLQKIMDYELSRGVMAICPTTMTYPEEKLSEVMESVHRARDYKGGAELIGINMEGPFISNQKVAAQNPLYVSKPDISMFLRLQERSGGMIKLVDIAPEIEGAFDFIKELNNQVVISLAHTAADYDTAKKAFRLGANHLTHMFNAMNPIGHRQPGPQIAALEENAYVELICDGVHVHDSIIRMVFELFDEDRIVLVSDSMMATGLGDGLYELGGQKVLASGNKCTLAESPDVIAGSNTDLFGCLRHAVLEAKVPIEKALKAVTINPARSIHVNDRYGQLDGECVDNAVVTDDKLNIKYLIRNGKIEGMKE